MAKYSDIAREMEKSGRYGDSRLVHINEAELAGIASLAPGGKLTTNPDTGLPEAFLPFLAPILGAVAGKAFLPAIATKLGGAAIGSALSPALAGAIGSGLATGLAENSLEKGLLAGITGFGIGSALGAGGAGSAAGAVAKEGAKAGIAKMGVQKASQTAMQDLLSQAAGDAAQSLPSAGLDAFGQSMAQTAPQSWGQVFQSGLSDIGSMAGNAGEIGSALMQPGTMFPAIYGLSGLANLDAMDQRRDFYNRMRADSDEERQSWIDLMNQSFYRPQMAQGGITSVDPQGYMAMRERAVKFADGGLITTDAPSTSEAAARQASLRGQYVNAPPEGFRPGIDPEFQYFTSEVTPNTVNPDAAPQITPGLVPSFVPSTERTQNSAVDGNLSDGAYEQRGFDLPQWSLPAGATLDTETGRIFMQDAPPPTRDLVANPLIQEPAFVSPETLEGIGSLPPLAPRDYNDYLMNVRRYTRRFSEGGVVEEEKEALEEKRKFPGLMGSLLPFSPEDLPDPIKKYTLWGGLLSGEGVPNFLQSGTLLGRFMAEGGMTGGDDEMVAEVVRAILGEHENGDAVISMFVEKHGPEVFAQLRSQVLQGVVPGAQTEGQMKGDGGGMDDDLMGMIGSSQPVALSTDEFVVPADVVSALGDGSSDAGAKVLYDMMDSVRRYKGGKTEQPPKMNPEMLERIKLGRP